MTGSFAFGLALAWWAGAAGGLTYWFWQRWLPIDSDDATTLAALIGLGDGRTPEIWLNLAIGVFALVTLPVVVRFAATLHGSLASVLLSSRAELQQDVQRAEGGRAAARQAEADSLRRLERDIHDGPQQRLVRLTMDLGRARRQLTDDPDRASETMDAALLQARETVDELRSLSRGSRRRCWSTAASSRRSASSPCAARCRSRRRSTCRTRCRRTSRPRLFVVAEALTNVAKHSEATRASVGVWMENGGVEVRIEDDGVGGAHLAKGSGLAGLEQRVLAADGRLEVGSPAGGPTVVAAFIPLGGSG